MSDERVRPLEDEPPLEAARGVALGLLIGAVIWIVIVILTLGIFNL